MHSLNTMNGSRPELVHFLWCVLELREEFYREPGASLEEQLAATNISGSDVQVDVNDAMQQPELGSSVLWVYWLSPNTQLWFVARICSDLQPRITVLG
jgi:hypothetical protein